MTISLFSWTKRRLVFGSVCRRCLSYSSQITFLLSALKTKSESCLTLMRASSLIAPKVYDALFIGIGVVSLIDSFIFVVSSSRAFCLACFFCSRISSPGGRRVVLHLRRLSIVGLLVLVGSYYHFGLLVRLFL